MLNLLFFLRFSLCSSCALQDSKHVNEVLSIMCLWQIPERKNVQQQQKNAHKDFLLFTSLVELSAHFLFTIIHRNDAEQHAVFHPFQGSIANFRAWIFTQTISSIKFHNCMHGGGGVEGKTGRFGIFWIRCNVKILHLIWSEFGVRYKPKPTNLSNHIMLCFAFSHL